MSCLPLPPDEEARRAALDRYALLDTPPERGFDRLAALAAHLFDVPLTLITLIDRERQWFKACQGPASREFGLTETSRDIAFCAHTILSDDVLVVEDSHRDSRFCDNPLVTGYPGIRFYVGAPLITREGLALGSLCLIDFHPRCLSMPQQAALRDLAASVVSEIELRHTAASLVKSERQYQQMFAKCPHPMWVFALDTLRFLDVNEAAVVHYGYRREEFLAMTVNDIRTPDEAKRLRASLPGQSANIRTQGIWQHQTKEGRVILAEIASCLMEYNDHPACLVIANNVTAREMAEAQLQESRQRYESLVENHPFAVCAIALNGFFLTMNGAGERLTGFAEAELQGLRFSELVAPESRADALRHFGLATQGQPQTNKLTLLHKEGKRERVRFTAVPIILEKIVTGVYVIAEDIGPQVALEAEREVLLAQTKSLLAEALERADHEPLTGLLNHRAFHKLLQDEFYQAQKQGLPLALLLMDMDNFKFFNHSYGHAAGDDLLRQVAQVLSSSVGKRDTLARFGGDEFALLMPGASEEKAAKMADMLRDEVRQVGYYPPGYDTPIPLSLSAGIASLAQDGPGWMEILEAADARLRASKSGGEAGRALQLRQSMAHSVEGFSMLDALVTAVDNKDRYTRKHSEDVMLYSVQIAQKLGMDEKTVHTVEVAALLHDVGKIGIPDAILRKPGKLSEADFQAIQQHPMMGAVIVGAVPGFEETLDAVRHHHERWDGQGYPFGLRGEETPLIARLMAVADAFSAMTTDRPYRKGMVREKALRILTEGAGTQWDPACVAAFLAAQERNALRDQSGQISA